MRLVPFDATHLDALRAFLDDPEILRFTRIPVPTPPDFAETWLARYEAGRQEGTREAFAALDDERSGGEASGRGRSSLVGLALLPTIDREAQEAELGYMVAPEHRGRGFATAMLRELTTWAFAHGIQRCELFIDVRNPASEHVAQRCGYVREGTLRSVHHRAGERIDVTVWSRLPSDPDP
jgi:RimJ/RimL family protein N-acetyltransferase